MNLNFLQIRKNEDFKNKSALYELIADATNSTQGTSAIFKSKMDELSELLMKIFESEYCAIGKAEKTNSNFIFSDYSIKYKKKKKKNEEVEQESECQKIRNANSNSDPNLLISEVFSKDKTDTIHIYNKDQIQQRIETNPRLQVYKEKILFSKEINNVVFIKLITPQDQIPIGYINLINTKKENVRNYINSLDKIIVQISNLVQFAIFGNMTIDADFFAKLICDTSSKTTDILEEIMDYLLKSFESAVIISFRIPMINWKEKKVYFYLVVPPKISLKEHYIIEQLYSERKFISTEEISNYSSIKCYPDPTNMVFDTINIDFLRDQELSISNRFFLIPIFRDVDINRCYGNHDHPRCKLEEICNYFEKNENLFGIFEIRLNKEIEPTDALKKRLHYIGLQIGFLLNSRIAKKEDNIIKDLQEKLQDIDFEEIYKFDINIVSLIKNIANVKLCSIYRKKDSEIMLTATSSGKYFDIEKNEYNDFEKELILSNDNNIVGQVFNSKKTEYIVNLQNSDKKNINIQEYFPRYIDFEKSVNLEEESVLSIPFRTKIPENDTVVLLIGKLDDDYNISPSFWEHDKQFFDFIIDFISRLSESNIAEKNKLDFLSQLRHELIDPITEIIQKNEYLLEYQLAPKGIFIEQIKDNIKSALLFDGIIKDYESVFFEDEKFKFNFEKGKLLSILLESIELLEKRAFVEKGLKISPFTYDMPHVYIDKHRMKQVFINLIKNAIQYSDDGTEIKIYYKNVTEDIDGSGKKQWHEIKFCNDGLGIKESDKDRIFKFRVRSDEAIKWRPQGSGIGLHVVQRIMKKHNGLCMVRKLKYPTEISIFLPYENNNL